MAHKTLERTTQVDATTMHVPRVLAETIPFEYDQASHREQVAMLAIGKALVVKAFEDTVDVTHNVRISPDKTIEQRRSAHQVGFGFLLRRSSNRAKDSKDAVAFKPFPKPDKAVDEMRGYLTLQELGIETFEPIGVFPAKHGEHFVAITKKRNDLTSLDQDTWVVGRQVVDEKTAEIAATNNKVVKGISELMAYIHSNGVYHPDGQIKNYAKTPEGEIGIIDTENLTQVDFSDSNCVDRAWHDINKLVSSLIINTQNKEDAELFGVGMLHGLSLYNVRESIEALVITPYLESLGNSEQEVVSEEKQTYLNTLFDGVYDRFYSDETWPYHFVEASRERG